MKEYKKLVRDNIPQKINNDGFNVRAIVLNNDKDFAEALSIKLLEEAIEYSNNDDSVEELADIFTVLVYILQAKGISLAEFLKIYSDKLAKNGGFDKRYYIIDTDEKK